MKKLKVFSFLAATIVIVIASFNFAEFTTSRTTDFSKADEISKLLNYIREISSQSATDTMSVREYGLKTIEIENQLKMIQENNLRAKNNQGKDSFTTQTFWIKVIFSGLFCAAALFVILSRRYDDDTKRWAFSVMTLIAGVWIGTVA